MQQTGAQQTILKSVLYRCGLVAATSSKITHFTQWDSVTIKNVIHIYIYFYIPNRTLKCCCRQNKVFLDQTASGYLFKFNSFSATLMCLNCHHIATDYTRYDSNTDKLEKTIK